MRFGLSSNETEEALTYGGYLRVSDLINLQSLRSDPPQHDETLFIIIHQVYELWFKQLLHELDTIIAKLDGGDVLGSIRLLRRCIEIQRVLVNQVAVLETMTPMDFLTFRDHLLPASGFQSSQFRELEFTSGNKDKNFLRHYKDDSPEYARLARRFGKPSLLDAFYSLLRRRGFSIVDKSENEDNAAHHRRIAELMRIYQEAENHYDLFLLAESLIEYDEMFALWRMRHVKMAERMIGSKVGTGGSDGVGYLKTTIEQNFFPDLWELRTYLGHGSGGCPVTAVEG